MTEQVAGAQLESATFYHVCFTVPDLDAAMQELTDLLGARFGKPVHSKLGSWPYSIVFTDTAPHIELISSVAGSPWYATTPQFHHLGWWSHCLDNTTNSWIDKGAISYFDGRDHGRHFTYVDAPHSGVRLEAVDMVQKAAFLQQWVEHPR